MYRTTSVAHATSLILREFRLSQTAGLHMPRHSSLGSCGSPRRQACVRVCVEKYSGSVGGVSGSRQEVGRTGRCVVYDDYAHHPTEVRATLQAARQRFDAAAIWVAFQPHTVSRLEWFLEDFGTAFSGADKVIVTEVFKARSEKGIEGDSMTGETLSEAIMSPPALYIPSISDAAERLARDVKMELMMDDERQVVIIVMGAGDSNTLGPELLQKLE
ncbi:hypothetical protein CYMTET_16801 [Cymbomonas tetramitiformis]|uniref:Mur ligase C-terminal domain-containing protein n=1 Tax=Cymbomonas tetramitiformis TaxID=36881 RepID=A0AAE0GBG7_9CHLO|nr:hypothetical protein CYMTET_16801 [Cymbomonas tetramitiformis]